MRDPARLDQVLRRRFPQWGRRAVQRLIGSRGVHVNGKAVWLASWQVHNGDRIDIGEAPAAKPAPLSMWDPAWLLAADEHMVVVDKPSGLLAEKPPYREAPNLHTLAETQFGPLVLVHRLDRDTSGVLVLARTESANRVLSAAFREHTIEKEYVAVVAAPNRLEHVGLIKARLAPDPQHRERMIVVAKGGQGAVTRYMVIASQSDRQWVRLWPQTGRTHQLRVHLASMQAPILGDRLYGDELAIGRTGPRLLLHARRLVLPPLPWDGERVLAAPVLPEFEWPDVELDAEQGPAGL
ncbi:MAG: RluA family pseudouridine synthase [Caldilineaceae bacterium]